MHKFSLSYGQMMNALNLLLGGVTPTTLDSNATWCGVDRGALYLIQRGMAPLFSFGDFDSVSAQEKQLIMQNSQRVFVKNDQNRVDLEFALDVLCEMPEVRTVNLYGATGGRLDHLLGNLALLSKPSYQHLALTVIDEHNRISVQPAGSADFSPLADYRYFSIFPLYPDTMLTILGAKYEAENLPLTMNRPNATSNEFIGQNKITIQVNQPVMVIYSKD